MSSNDEAQILQKFQDGFASGRLGHAYLLVGNPRGGAARLTEKILQMLFCEAEKPPCGACKACQRTARRLNPDIIWIEPIKKSRGILVGQIEEVLRQTFQTAFAGGWKAMVLAGAERMNTEAANKLLKTLEEPPPRSIFLLLSDQPEALLPTVVSRCQRVVLPESLDEPAEDLRDEVVQIASDMGQGSVAKRLLDARALLELLKKTREQVEDESDQASNSLNEGEREDIEEIGQGRIEAEYRERRWQILRLLLLWQRDLLLAANGLEDDLLFFRSAAKRIRGIAGKLTGAEPAYNMNEIGQMQSRLDQHLPENFVIERAFLQFKA